MAGKKYLRLVSGVATGTNSIQTSSDSPVAGDIVALNSNVKVDVTLLPDTAMVAKSISYVLTATDGSVNFTTGVSALTATLPTAASAGVGRRYLIRKVDTGSGTVTLAAAGGDTLSMTIVPVLNLQYDAITVESDGVSTWYQR